MLLTYLDPIVRPLPRAFLIPGSPRGTEGIELIAGKTAGKISAIIGIILAFHRDLFARIKLWGAAHSQHERRMQHRAFERSSFDRHEAPRVVIADKRRHLSRI